MTHFQNLEGDTAGGTTEHSRLFHLFSSLAGQQAFSVQVTPVS